MPDLSDLNAPEFAPLKAQLARAYLDHKADVGAPHPTDEAIVDRTDEITALMLGAMARAIACGAGPTGTSLTAPTAKPTPATKGPPAKAARA
jgi:hypothetical protein